MRYVVTGAAGFIGSHLARGLLDRGDEVAPVDSFTDYYDASLKEENAAAAGLGVERLDLARDDLDLDGIDGVFHLAAQPGVRASWGEDFRLYVERNLLATQRVFEAASAARIRVVFASSSSVYGDAETYPTPEDARPLPISPYGITKLGCEELARAYGKSSHLDAVVLRYFTVYGPRQRPDMSFTRLLTALAERRTFDVYGDGSQSRAFTYVADAVDATIAAMVRAPGGAVYNVGGGAEATLAEAIETAERVSGLELDRRHLPSAPGDVQRTAPDTTRIATELGWSARVGLEDGMRAQWAWVASRVGAR